MGVYVSSSGPTNSMPGAAFLASLESGNKPGVKGEAALVVDIGITTVSYLLFMLLSRELTEMCSFVRSCGSYFLDRSRDVIVRPFPLFPHFIPPP